MVVDFLEVFGSAFFTVVLGSTFSSFLDSTALVDLDALTVLALTSFLDSTLTSFFGATFVIFSFLGSIFTGFNTSFCLGSATTTGVASTFAGSLVFGLTEETTFITFLGCAFALISFSSLTSGLDSIFAFVDFFAVVFAGLISVTS